METAPRLITVGSGIRLLSIETDMFKTACITLNVLVPMGEYDGEYAVLSSFLAHTSKEYDTQRKLSSRLEELYGAALSGNITKLGENYKIQLSITCIDDSLAFGGESISKSSLELLLSLFTNPLAADEGFDSLRLEIEKRLYAEEIEAELNDKRQYSVLRMIENMCADEPYGLKRSELLQMVKDVTPESAYKAWKKMLLNGIIQLNVIGNIDASVCESSVKNAFSPFLPEREPFTPETVFVEQCEDVTEKTESMVMNQSKLVLGFRTGMKDEDDDFYARRIMTDVFGGGPYSRLFMNVREKRSLCYYCSARLISQKGIMLIQSGIEKENKNDVLDEINRQLKVMQNGEFTDEELAASKRAICDAYIGFGDTPDMLDTYYSMKLTGEITTPEEAAKRFDKVSREDVVKAAEALTLDTVYMLSGEEKEESSDE